MIEIIPAIDLINHKCVRLTKGDYSTRKEYNDDPVDMAQYFEREGASSLHIVDLDAAAGKIDAHHELIGRIIASTNLNIQVGGGIRTIDQVENLLALGAKKVIVGSTAFKDRHAVVNWIKKIGSDSIIIGADVSDRKIAIDGWQKTSNEEIEEFISFYLKNGGKEFLCTDISKDGMMEGPALELYKDLMNKYPNATFIASGGVTSEMDIQRLIDIGMKRIIVGKAIYEGKLDIKQLVEKFESC